MRQALLFGRLRRLLPQHPILVRIETQLVVGCFRTSPSMDILKDIVDNTDSG
jgi:hypothetical protein